MRLRLAASLIALLAAAAPATASQCSCPGIDLRSSLAAGQAAVVATVLAEPHGRVYAVRVRRSYNARLGSRSRIAVPRGCWPHFERGDTLSGLVRRARRGWVAQPCARASPPALQRAARPYPRPAGEGQLGWLSYQRYPASGQVLALSAAGRPLGYGFGDRSGRQVADASVCPGSERFAEIASTGDVYDGVVLQIRAARTLRVVRRVRLARYFSDVFCRDRAGDDVFLFESADGRARLARVHGREQTTPYTGSGESATFTSQAAYLSAGPKLDILREVDLDTAHKRDIARAPTYVSEWSVSPDRAGFAGVAIPEPGSGRRSIAVVVELVGGGAHVRTRPLGREEVGELVWLAAERVAYVPAGDPRGRQLRLFDRGLRLLGRRRLGERDVSFVDGRFVEEAGRRLYEFSPEGGRGRLIARFPPDADPSVSVPDSPAVAPGRTWPRIRVFRGRPR